MRLYLRDGDGSTASCHCGNPKQHQGCGLRSQAVGEGISMPGDTKEGPQPDDPLEKPRPKANATTAQDDLHAHLYDGETHPGKHAESPSSQHLRESFQYDLSTETQPSIDAQWAI